MGIGFNISGEYLDLYPNTDVIFDYAPNNFAELNTRQGITSVDFDVPRTARNERLLLESTVSAVLESEGGSQFKGFLRVHKRQSFVNQKITLFFSASNTEWITLIKGLGLRDLNLERYNHEYNATNIVNSFTNKDGFIYPLIDYGNAENKTSFAFEVEELAPAVYASTILKQIFQDIGIVVEGTLLNNLLFNKIVLPFSEEVLPASNANIDISNLIVKEIDANGTFDMRLSNFYSSEVDEIDFGNNAIVNNNNFPVPVIIKSGTGVSVTYEETFTINILDSNSNVTFFRDETSLQESVEAEIIIPANGFIKFQVTVGTYSGSVDDGKVAFSLVVNNSFFARDGVIVSVKDSLPDISQEDFLSYIFFTFAVLAQYNVSSKTITLNQYNDLEANKDIAVNVSGLIDLIEGVEENFDEVSQEYAQINELEYASDNNDVLIDEFDKRNSKALGFGALEIVNPQLSESSSLYSAPFSGTFNRDTFINDDTFETVPYLPYLPRLNEDTGVLESELEPRILIVERGFDFGQPVNIGSESSDTAPFSYFVKSITNNLKYNDITASLAFSNFGITAPNDTPIIETELSLIKRILSKGVGISIYLGYDLDRIQNIDFSIPLYFELEELTGYYFVSGIENIDGQSYSYKFNLIKI